MSKYDKMLELNKRKSRRKSGRGSPDNTDNGVGERKGVRTSTDAKDWLYLEDSFTRIRL